MSAQVGDCVSVATYPSVLKSIHKINFPKVLQTVTREFLNRDEGTLSQKEVESIVRLCSSVTSDPSKLQNNSGSKHNGKAGNKKKKTVWHDGSAKISKEAMASLDQSKVDDTTYSNDREVNEAKRMFIPDEDELEEWEEEERQKDQDSGWVNKVQRVLGFSKSNSSEECLHKVKQNLLAKNVNPEIVDAICKSISKKMGRSEVTDRGLKQALEGAITKILTVSQTQNDILRNVITKRSRTSAKPYVIVAVGINGVGKSTSLAKLAYYLKRNGCSPLLAACDTFRAGAVEQLGVHAKCLDLPLYSKGYAKDPSSVAQEAIQEAVAQKCDVVLVDTAGRMQNNLPLMKALQKLVIENQPDLVCFVGEALVGNDGIDQLKMFDQGLKSTERSRGKSGGIDGIILTKYDTVSEKVGATLSMAYITGKPVLFVGTGQKYHHLKKLSVSEVTRSLFS